MALVLSEEQRLLKETAREFVQEKSPVSELRRLRDEVDDSGFDRSLWNEMAELGWASVIYPEEYGGMGLGYVELGQILEECGRTLTAQPLLSTVVMAGGCILAGGNETQKKDLLPAIVDGNLLMALACQEGPHHNPYRVATSATLSGSDYVISGQKNFVIDGHVAGKWVVVARTSGQSDDRAGLSLFLLDADAPGLEITRTLMIDGRNAARAVLSDVTLDSSALIGELDRGADILDSVLDRATAALCAEMLGVMSEALDQAVEYLKTRQQFGKPIGSFQALKHRAAEMFVELELSRSIVLDSLSAIDAGRPDESMVSSCAKARCNDAVYLLGNEAVQMYGGLGVTDEQDIGLYLKRARATQATLGNSAWHRERYARLCGY